MGLTYLACTPVALQKFFSGKLLSSMWQSGECGYGHIKIRTKNNILFHGEKKCTKADEKRILCKSTLTSWRGPSPRHCPRATQLLSKKCGSGGQPLATLCVIWPARDLNLGPPAPETNILPLDLQIDQLHTFFFYLDSTFMWELPYACYLDYSRLIGKTWGSAINLELNTALNFHCSILLLES